MVSKNFKDLVNIINKRIANGMDAVIAVSGEEGIGKSTFTLQLALELLKDKSGVDAFDMERNIAYTAEESLNKIADAPFKSCVVIDEAGRLFFKRDAMSSKTKKGVKLFQQIRFKNLCVLMAIPPFFSLDREIRNNRVWIWVHIYARGKGLVFLKDRNIFIDDPWHQAETQGNIYRKYHTVGDSQAKLIAGYTKSKNFVGVISFDKLAPDFEKRYTDISHVRKLTKDVEKDVE